MFRSCTGRDSEFNRKIPLTFSELICIFYASFCFIKVHVKFEISILRLSESASSEMQSNFRTFYSKLCVRTCENICFALKFWLFLVWKTCKHESFPLLKSKLKNFCWFCRHAKFWKPWYSIFKKQNNFLIYFKSSLLKLLWHSQKRTKFSHTSYFYYSAISICFLFLYL